MAGNYCRKFRIYENKFYPFFLLLGRHFRIASLSICSAILRALSSFLPYLWTLEFYCILPFSLSPSSCSAFLASLSISPLPLADFGCSSRCETRDKRPLGRNPDKSWCHLHTLTMIKLFWPEPMAQWTSGPILLTVFSDRHKITQDIYLFIYYGTVLNF